MIQNDQYVFRDSNIMILVLMCQAFILWKVSPCAVSPCHGSRHFNEIQVNIQCARRCTFDKELEARREKWVRTTSVAS